MGTLTAAVRRRAINSRAYASAPYRAAFCYGNTCPVRPGCLIN